MAENRQRPYIGTTTLDLFRTLLGLAGLVLSVGAVLYAINGMTQAPAAVSVPVALADTGLTYSGEAPIAVTGLPEGSRVYAPTDALVLASWDSTRIEWLLARGDVLLLGLGLGAAALLLMPVLSSLSRGVPFAAGNARRIGAVAVVVLVVGYVGPLLPQLAAVMVIDRLDLEPGDPFVWSLTFSLLPLLIATLILVTAEAFRRGEAITADVEGLV